MIMDQPEFYSPNAEKGDGEGDSETQNRNIDSQQEHSYLRDSVVLLKTKDDKLSDFINFMMSNLYHISVSI